ncbi:hypothetical protein KSW81_002345 [Nannochloris sp. 'desiccata']|nr:hypothetical protein KSW81_002345 [Chlorella desiccata (nom. nud.)]
MQRPRCLPCGNRPLVASPPKLSLKLSRPDRRAKLVIANVAEFTRAAPAEVIMCAKIAAHSASLASVTVLEDSDKSKKIVTTSLDKTVALWTSEGGCDALCNSGYSETHRFTPPGGPVFSTLLDRRSDDGLPDQLYLGAHGKHVTAWVPPRAQLEAGVVLDGHCGWVRALAASAGNRWLFSAACKEIRQWDMARAVPSAAGTTVVEKGDILAMTASKTTVFTAGSDGSIRSFTIGKSGGLTPAACRPKAHNDRVCALVLDGGILFSASYDGSIKSWDADSLEIVAASGAAHGGERVNCLALGPGRLLYSGGGDCLVRRWMPGLLTEAAVPLHAHNHSVCALGAGRKDLLVSGDNGGEIAVWKVQNNAQ